MANLYGINDLVNGKGIDHQTKEKIRRKIYELLKILMARAGEEAVSEGMIKAADKVIRHLTNRFIRRFSKKALTKTSYYPVVKKVGKSVGVSITKVKFATGVATTVAVAADIAVPKVINLTIRTVRRALIRRKAIQLKKIFREIAKRNLG